MCIFYFFLLSCSIHYVFYFHGIKKKSTESILTFLFNCILFQFPMNYMGKMSFLLFFLFFLVKYNCELKKKQNQGRHEAMYVQFIWSKAKSTIAALLIHFL